MKPDAVVVIFILVGALISLLWWIRHSLQTGRWRGRGATVYRNKNPRLFLGIIICLWASFAYMMVILLFVLDFTVICDGHVTRRDCLSNQLHAFRN
jgi:ABC-type Fe3+ transport system permease subunit